MVERAGAPSGSGQRVGSRRFEGWVTLAVGLHALGALSTWALVVPSSMWLAVQDLRRAQRDLFTASLDVENVEHVEVGVAPPEPVAPPPPPAPGPDESSPALTPQAMKPIPAESSPPSPAPAVPEPLTTRAQRAVVAAADAVAEAAKALTRDDDDPGAVAIASGENDAPTSGYVAGAGLGKVSTFNPRAFLLGKPGGVGKSTRPDAELGPDRSRGARVIGGFTDQCAFPVQADAAGIDHAVVVVMVRVKPDGTAASVTVVSDPGYGFGRAAEQCALKTQYVSARDREGKPTPSETGPINVRFTR